MDIVTLVTTQIRIGIGWLHHIDRCHQTCTLVGRIAIDDDVLDGRAQLHVTALLQPSRNTSVIQIAGSQSLVVHQQWYQLMDVICYKVALWVNDEATVFQQW